MAPVSTVSRALARSAAFRLPTNAVRAMSTTPAACGSAASSTFQSPFKGESKTTRIPDFSKYKASGGSTQNALISYFMVGTLGAISAAGAKSTVQGKKFALTYDVVGC